MPYNPSTGVYSLPAIYLAIPGTVIIAAQHNTPLEDLATANNYPRPIIAGGTGANNATSAANNLKVVSYNSQAASDDEKATARANIDVDEKVVYAAKSANYTAVVGDNNASFRFTATATVAFDPAATLGANWHVRIRADGADVTIDPNGSELINGASTLTVLDGSTVDVICSGSAFYASVSFQTTTAINKFSGGWEPIGKLALTGQTSVAVTDLSAYLMIRCTYNHIVTAQSVLIQFSTNNGSSWLTSASDYFYIFTQTAWNGSTSSVAGDANTIAGLSLGEEVSGGVMNIVSFNKARVCQSNSTQSIDTTSLRIARNISQRTIGTTARNALRIISSAGGGISGEFQFEGIRG